MTNDVTYIKKDFFIWISKRNDSSFSTEFSGVLVRLAHSPSLPLSRFRACVFFFSLSLFLRFFPFLFHPFAFSLDLFLIISLFHPSPPVLFSFPLFIPVFSLSFPFSLFLCPLPSTIFLYFLSFRSELLFWIWLQSWRSADECQFMSSTLIMSLLPNGHVSTVSISSTATRITRSKAGANHPRYTESSRSRKSSQTLSAMSLVEEMKTLIGQNADFSVSSRIRQYTASSPWTYSRILIRMLINLEVTSFRPSTSTMVADSSVACLNLSSPVQLHEYVIG